MKFLLVLVQSFTFPTSPRVTRLDNLGPSYSSATEIVRFRESFIFVPTWAVLSGPGPIWTVQTMGPTGPKKYIPFPENILF